LRLGSAQLELSCEQDRKEPYRRCFTWTTSRSWTILREIVRFYPLIIIIREDLLI
jgi:hypothetical protein